MKSAGMSAVVEPLLALEREDLTGTLEFRARGVVTQIHARAGEIIFAEGGVLGERLGRLLVRAGRLSEEHFGAVVRRMVDSLVDRDQVRFGEVAVEFGFLDAQELDLALAQQVREKIIGCVHRGVGEWRFSTDARRLDDLRAHVVRTRPILVEATRDLPERRVEEILRIDEHRYPEIVAPERVIMAEFELTEEEAEILEDLDGTASFQFLFSKAEVPGAAGLIAALVLGGGVDLRETPAGTRPDLDTRVTPTDFRTQRRAASTVDDEHTDQMAHAPVTPGIPSPINDERGGAGRANAVRERSEDNLNDAEDVSTLAVVRAPERRPSRESLPPLTEETRARAREGFELLRNALETRRPSSEKKRWPDPKNDRERRLMAESAFHRGRLFLRTEAAERALPGLHRALELRSEEREYELYVKWAQMIVNDTFKEDRRRTEIQTLAALVIREDRSCELAYSILGHCTLYDGKDEVALRFFRRALTLDGELVDAARSADVLTARLAGQPQLRTAGTRGRPKGLLEPMIDEIVPAPPLHEDRRVRRPRRRMSSSQNLLPDADGGIGAATPYGGLQAAPPVTMGTLAFGGIGPNETLVLPRPAPTASGSPAAAAADAALYPMPPPPAAMTPAEASVMSAPPPMPTRSDRGSESVPAGLVGDEPSEVDEPDNPFADARRRRRITVVLALLGFAAVGAATVAVATVLPERGRTTAADAGSGASSIAVTAAPTTPSATAPGGLAPPQASTPPAATTAPNPTTLPPTTTATAPAATTGTLRTRAHGHRIFVDGRVIGEGGKDHTLPCGPHRVRIGSAGAERAIVVPCGGAVAVE